MLIPAIIAAHVLSVSNLSPDSILRKVCEGLIAFEAWRLEMAISAFERFFASPSAKC